MTEVQNAEKTGVCENVYEAEEGGSIKISKLGDDQSLTEIIEKLLLEQADSKVTSFKKLHLCDPELEALRKDILKGYTFERIIISESASTLRVHPLAFDDEAAAAVKEFRCGDYSAATLQHDPKNSEKELISDVDGFLSRLVNCEEIYIKPYKAEVPALILPKLQRLLITGYHSSQKITKLPARALAGYASLKCLMIAGGKITDIDPLAFCFDACSSEKLSIELWDCSLDERAFPKGALEHFRRPVKFDWQFNQTEYLMEEIFRPFLDAHPENEVVITDEELDSDHEENQWIYKKTSAAENESENLAKTTDDGYEGRVILEMRP